MYNFFLCIMHQMSNGYRLSKYRGEDTTNKQLFKNCSDKSLYSRAITNINVRKQAQEIDAAVSRFIEKISWL